ncbi:MAG TPA: dihydrodipicolinate reductase C-terminal domain-containing protein [Terriglobales bacterium]|nr:dihydrodipicolinate reductase C-terminal domain-containing protein [Terriglobales bacterium]
MNLLLLGHGKTGALVEEVARQRGHSVRVLTYKENPHASALGSDHLRGVDALIDFTTPEAVVENLEACIRARKPIVVGTTGWYQHIPRLEEQTRKENAAVLYGSNFSIGVNVFFEIAMAAAAACAQGYVPTIVERHHVHKKDAPSGTAASLQRIFSDIAHIQPEITSVREGETIGTHVVLLDSPSDTMMLVHDAKNRRGFADGAVRAAEWLVGKTGFYEFRNIYRQLPT